MTVVGAMLPLLCPWMCTDRPSAVLHASITGARLCGAYDVFGCWQLPVPGHACEATVVHVSVPSWDATFLLRCCAAGEMFSSVAWLLMQVKSAVWCWTLCAPSALMAGCDMLWRAVWDETTLSLSNVSHAVAAGDRALRRAAHLAGEMCSAAATMCEVVSSVGLLACLCCGNAACAAVWWSQHARC
jgi:hypothetical protein